MGLEITRDELHEMMVEVADASRRQIVRMVSEDFAVQGRRIDRLSRQFTKRFAQVDGRLDGIDGRLDGIDGRLDGIDTRIDQLDASLGETNQLLHTHITDSLSRRSA